MMDDSNQSDHVNAREISKSQNRTQLLEATAEAIYKFGIRGTTTATIQELSGLSRGMVNLHFNSKENLLQAVVSNLAKQYARNWRQATVDPDLSTPDRLKCLIIADFDVTVLNARNVAIWFAFRAEASAKPEYRQYIDSRDQGFRDTMFAICSELVDQGPYPECNPALATNAFIAVLEGMWTDFHLHSDTFDRTKAIAACLLVAKSFFPKHF